MQWWWWWGGTDRLILVTYNCPYVCLYGVEASFRFTPSCDTFMRFSLLSTTHHLIHMTGKLLCLCRHHRFLYQPINFSRRGRRLRVVIGDRRLLNLSIQFTDKITLDFNHHELKIWEFSQNTYIWIVRPTFYYFLL